MKRLLSCFLIFSCIFKTSFTQQIECGGGVFYGLSSSSSIYKMTLSGNTITLDGMVVPAPAHSLFALAISGTILETNAFYSSKTLNQLMRYDGTQWQLMFTDTAVFHNAAGNDNSLYYHQLGTPNLAHNRIARYDNGNLALMWNDPVEIAVSDIAVDSAGNVYFFTGTTGNQVLHVMAPSGTITNSYPAPFPNTTAYGCLFMNGVLYVGVGATNTPPNRLLLPVIISGGTATVGAGIQMPAPVTGGTVGNPQYLDFKDLASCHPRNTLPVTLVAFTAHRIHAKLSRLMWKVTNEVDMQYYEPQYSTEGTRFSAIDQVTANASSSVEGSYVYEHTAIARGSIFYRLKLVDKQGRVQYSKIIKLPVDENIVSSLYPNPAKDKVFIEYGGHALNVTVIVRDVWGRTVYNAQHAASGIITLPLNFPTGQYAVTIADDENVVTRKLVKQ